MALLGAVCTQYPDAKLSIIFLPFFTFSAQSVRHQSNILSSLQSRLHRSFLGIDRNDHFWFHWNTIPMEISRSFSSFGWCSLWNVCFLFKSNAMTIISLLFSFYVKYGYKYLWDSLKPIVEHWHRLREKFSIGDKWFVIDVKECFPFFSSRMFKKRKATNVSPIFDHLTHICLEWRRTMWSSIGDFSCFVVECFIEDDNRRNKWKTNSGCNCTWWRLGLGDCLRFIDDSFYHGWVMKWRDSSLRCSSFDSIDFIVE